jgi:hypothetical protein
MSQIPRSQLALKKKSEQTASVKKHTNGSSNGHTLDKDIIIIDDEFTAIPVGREEVIEQQELPPPSQKVDETSPMKKKRGRKPRESRDSDTSETSKKSELNNDDITEEILKAISAEDFTPEASPKQELPSTKRKTRAERLQNASTIVNLSSISTAEDQSTKMSNDVTLETPSKPERRVSGRRSTRPIDDIKFSYRSPENNDSMDATTNATIGSELGNSIIETPAKRRATDSIDDDEVVESPKRSRLDISALFSNFTSPVSLLRNKFMRANIASTPKVGLDVLNDSEISLNASSELKEVDLNAEEAKEGADDIKIIVKPLKKSTCSIM